jgi:hypothetical protein
MKYIIITKHAHFIVSQDELDRFQKNYAGSDALIPFKNQFINKLGVEIYELPFYIKNENERLRLKGLRRCKYCGVVGNMLDKCGCHDRKELRQGNEFLLDDEQAKKISGSNPVKLLN